MSRAILRDRAAVRDLLDAFTYLVQRSPQSADRFLDAAERTFALLARRPGVGALHDPTNPAYGGIRVSPVTRFRSYLIVYRATDDRLDVIRVLHAARDIDGILSQAFDPA